VIDDLASELLEAADEARRSIEEALEMMVFRFELAMTVALGEALTDGDESEVAA
jgi:hypothetical protein